MNYDKLKAQLRIDEGVRYSRYKDTMGIWTIGVGHNIDVDRYYPYKIEDEPLSDVQVDVLLNEDVAKVVSDLDQNANWWRACPDGVQCVIAGLCFNMGWHGLSQFTNTLGAMHDGRYSDAASGLLASKYATQVGKRADRYADVLKAAGNI